jgi:hypothetical protein
MSEISILRAHSESKIIVSAEELSMTLPFKRDMKIKNPWIIGRYLSTVTEIIYEVQ